MYGLPEAVLAYLAYQTHCPKKCYHRPLLTLSALDAGVVLLICQLLHLFNHCAPGSTQGLE